MAPFERVNCCWCTYMYMFNSLRTCGLDFDFNSPVTASCQSHCYDCSLLEHGIDALTVLHLCFQQGEGLLHFKVLQLDLPEIGWSDQS